MRLWRQLRWRIVGSHMIVVIVGVVTLLLATGILLARLDRHQIEPSLIALTEADNRAAVEQASDDLLAIFQSSLLSALIIAALSAVVAGLLTSLPLTRGMARSLQDITRSSQRIASGHYDERVAIAEIEELAHLATNFNQMAEALEHIEQQRVALIGNVSHELRTPLSGIEGYLEGVMDGLFPKDDETFAHMYQEVRRLRRLVDDLQALSKVEAGQITLQPDTFDLVPIIHRVAGQLRPQAQAQAIEIVIDIPERVRVYADEDRTAQILVNLTGNAIRYTPEGGTISLRVTTDPHLVTIAVQDTGQGIPAEALPYLFERFYRVDPSRSRQSGGSGIGLTIARHLAWAMGGELTAHSDGPGQGSTFTLTLPGHQAGSMF